MQFPFLIYVYKVMQGGDVLQKLVYAILLALIFNFTSPVCSVVNANEKGLVVVVELSGEIDQGQAELVLRGLREAKEKNAKAFILQIDTFGGLVAAATKMRDAINDSDIPTICYIKNRAWSAGALIAIAHDKIAITPSGSIGAAEPIPTTEKTIAAVKAEFRATAERAGRDPRVAEAMVDKTLGFGEYAAKGQILALTGSQAVEVGYADFVANDRTELLEKLGFADYKVEVITQNWKESSIGILEQPAVKSALLSIIILAIIAEIKTAGTGIGAAIAIVAAALLYGSSFIFGLSGWLEPLLFFMGMIFIAIEIFIPGFGIFGIAGICSIITSFFLILGGFDDLGKSLMWLAVSIACASVLCIFILKRLPSSRLWNRFVLQNTASKQEGFSTGNDYEKFLGQKGTVVTQLRPGGTAEFDGKRFDVLTYGEFVESGTKVVVVKVEGNKLFVKVLEEN